MILMTSNIDTSDWGNFVVGKLFDIHPTKAYKLTNKELLTADGINPVVVNSKLNNGIGGYASLDTTEEGNMITFSDTSSAEAIFYQGEPFVGYPHIQGMYPIGDYKDCWTKEALLFFLVVFKRKAKDLGYNYVNKFERKLASKIAVRLPIDKNGIPNWNYMIKYIQTIEESVSSSMSNLLKAVDR